MVSGHRAWEYAIPHRPTADPSCSASRGAPSLCARRHGRRIRASLFQGRLELERTVECRPDRVADHGSEPAALELVERLRGRPSWRGDHVAKLGNVLAALERELGASLHGVEHKLASDVARESEV